MQCSCGGETHDHHKQRFYKVVACYAQCTACGRIEWLWDARTDDEKREVTQGREVARKTPQRDARAVTG